MVKTLVTGAGGFIGHHLVTRLVREGHWVRAVDIKVPEYEPSPAQEFLLLDLREPEFCLRAVDGMEWVYHLAADMGGIGYIEREVASITLNNTLINANMVRAALLAGVKRLFFSSSACVYPAGLQRATGTVFLKESDAIPAEPERGYGWEKLFMEQMCEYCGRLEHRLETRVARFHNVYGPLGTYDGGREKSIAALCRKMAKAQDEDVIEIWGDGTQLRSYLYVDDCVEGVLRLMASAVDTPCNIGSDSDISVQGLARMIEAIAGKHFRYEYKLDAPKGVHSRCSDNTFVRSVLGWEPQVPLQEGVRRTYEWIRGRVCI